MANTIRIPVPDVAYARVSLPKIGIEDNPYESLASAAAGIGDALAERQALDDAERLSKFRAVLHKTTADRVHEDVRSGATGPGLTQSTDKALNDQVEHWKSQTNDAKLRAEMDRIHQSLRLPALDVAMRVEADARASGAVRIADATMEELAEIAYRWPDQIGAVREEARMLRKHLGDQGLGPDGGEQKINEAYLRGLIASNPKLALETLRSRKGGAEEDLGIPEPLREALEHEAERAADAEHDSYAAEQENAQIGHRLDAYAKLAASDASGTFQHGIYAGVRDAYKVNPATGRDLETKTDAARERATIRAKRHHAIGHALVNGTAIDWDEHHLESLDTYIEAVADDGSGAAIADRRRIRMAAIAGTTPPKLQAHIREGLRASDPTRRAGSVRMLQALDAADDSGKLTSWLSANLRAFGHRFTALGAAGFTDADALKHLDAANAVSAAKEIARGRHFDTYVRVDGLTGALGNAFGIKPSGIAKDGIDIAESRTLEYRPARVPHAADHDAPPNEEAKFQNAGFPLLALFGRERMAKAARSAGYSVAADIVVTMIANVNKPPHERTLPSWESLLMSAVSGAASGVVEGAPGEPWKWEAGIAVLGSLAEDALAQKDFNYWAAIGAGVGAGLWQKWGKEKFKASFGEKPLSQAAGKTVSKAIKEIFGAEIELTSDELAEFMRGFARAVESEGRDILDYWQKQFDDWFWSGDEDPLI